MDISLISAIGGLTIGLAGIISTVWINVKVIQQKNREDEKKEIYKKLNDFYGPLLQHRNKSRKLYELFKSNDDKKLPTLKALLQGKQYTGNDKALLDEIIQIGKTCEELILTKAGLVDDEKLRQNILPKAAAHYYIIRMAYLNNIQGDIERFENYVFPEEFDVYIEKKIQDLQNRLMVLNK